MISTENERRMGPSSRPFTGVPQPWPRRNAIQKPRNASAVPRIVRLADVRRSLARSRKRARVRIMRACVRAWVRSLLSLVRMRVFDRRERGANLSLSLYLVARWPLRHVINTNRSKPSATRRRPAGAVGPLKRAYVFLWGDALNAARHASTCSISAGTFVRRSNHNARRDVCPFTAALRQDGGCYIPDVWRIPPNGLRTIPFFAALRLSRSRDAVRSDPARFLPCGI